MRERATILALVAAILLALPGTSRGSSDKLVPSGASPDLFLIFTGDVIGYVEPCG